jgi:hypothetical protein
LKNVGAPSEGTFVGDGMVQRVKRLSLRVKSLVDLISRKSFTKLSNLWGRPIRALLVAFFQPEVLPMRSKPVPGAAGAVLALLVLSCQKEASVVAPAVNSATTTATSLQGRFRVRAGERAFVELAEKVPSSAGFYFDTDGSLVVVVRDRVDDATASAQAVLFVRHISDVRLKTGIAKVEPGEYTFRQLAAWRDIVFDNILGQVPGVTILDLQEQTNRVRIGLSTPAAASLLSILPSRLVALGVDTAAVIYDTVDPVDATLRHMVPRFVADSVSSQFQWDTLVGGIYVESGGGGCTATVVATQGSAAGVVAASHCTSETFGSDGDDLEQATSRTVGMETNDPDGWTCIAVFECRNSDAAFFSISGGINYAKGLIARTQFSAGAGSGAGSRAIDTSRPYFLVDAVDADQGFVGQYVHKIGATTGWTWGQIVNTCEDHSGDFWNIVECAYESSMYIQDGDSGAPVFTPYGDGYGQNTDLVKLVGIVKAKIEGPPFRSIFSKWSGVVTDLGSIDPIRAATLSTPSISGSIVTTSPNVTWSAVSGASRYNLFKYTPSGGLLSIGTTTSTSFSDGDSNVLEYTGSTEPTSWATRIQYHVYAVSSKDKSVKSNVIWYRAAVGTFSVNINGPAEVGPNTYQCSQWLAQVTGASTIVSYNWTGQFTSSDYYVTGTIPQTGATLNLVVVDDQSRQGYYSKQVTYNANNTDVCQ